MNKGRNIYKKMETKMQVFIKTIKEKNKKDTEETYVMCNRKISVDVCKKCVHAKKHVKMSSCDLPCYDNPDKPHCV